MLYFNNNFNENHEVHSEFKQIKFEFCTCQIKIYEDALSFCP